MKIQRKQCATFIISDFIDRNDLTDMLKMAQHRYDVNAVQVYDIRMSELPDVGLVELRDAETGHIEYVDTSSRRIRDAHHRIWEEQQQRLRYMFRRSGVRSVSIPTDGDYVKSLMNLFANKI